MGIADRDYMRDIKNSKISVNKNLQPKYKYKKIGFFLKFKFWIWRIINKK